MTVNSTLASFPITHYMPHTPPSLCSLRSPGLFLTLGLALCSLVPAVLSKGSPGPFFLEMKGNIFSSLSDYRGDPTDIRLLRSSDAECPVMLRADLRKESNPAPNASSIPLKKT